MVSDDFKQSLTDSSKAFYNQANELTGGALNILAQAIKRFNERNAFDASASIAYYALFSLFPLLLVLIALGGVWLESKDIQFQLLRLAAYIFPGSLDYLSQIINEVLTLRRSASILGLIGLLWSATNVFNALAYNINCAWNPDRMRGFFSRRLLALAIVSALFAFLLLSVVSTAIIDLLSQFNVSLAGFSLTGETSLLTRAVSRLLPVFFRLFIFVGLYRWVPTTRVDWTEALWGAVVATLGWEVTTLVFTWYLSSGWGRFELIYGSLGTIIALMLWIYIGSLITLFGAYLGAAVAEHRRSRKPI